MPRQFGQSIPKGQRDSIRQRAWQMSKDGRSVVRIAERLDLNRTTVQNLLNEQYAENRDLRKSTGVAGGGSR